MEMPPEVDASMALSRLPPLRGLGCHAPPEAMEGERPALKVLPETDVEGHLRVIRVRDQA
jgi:hypothetical protein